MTKHQKVDTDSAHQTRDRAAQLLRLDDKGALNMRLGLTAQTRKIGRQRRSVRGYLTVKGVAVDYESTLERDLLILLDFDPEVTSVIGQPIRLDFMNPRSGKATHYTPDFYAAYAGQRPREVLYECKYRADLWRDFAKLKPGFKEARRVAVEHGMRHSIVTEREIRTPYLENATFLRRYATTAPDSGIEECMAATLASLGVTTPRTLMQAMYAADENRWIGLPFMWRMIAGRRIIANLHEALTMSSPITIIPGEGYRWTDPYRFR